MELYQGKHKLCRLSICFAFRPDSYRATCLEPTLDDILTGGYAAEEGD